MSVAIAKKLFKDNIHDPFPEMVGTGIRDKDYPEDDIDIIISYKEAYNKYPKAFFKVVNMADTDFDYIFHIVDISGGTNYLSYFHKPKNESWQEFLNEDNFEIS